MQPQGRGWVAADTIKRAQENRCAPDARRFPAPREHARYHPGVLPPGRDHDDFREEPPPKFFRVAPGREVRLRNAYLIQCVEVVKDSSGAVSELRCTYDPQTRGGDAPDGRKVKATLHWVAARTAAPAEIRLYDHLFVKPDPDDVAPGETYLSNLNPDALKVVTGLVEPSVAHAAPGTRYQFERQGYFCVDTTSAPGKPIFNRTVTLRDTWAKIVKASRPGV